MVLLKVYLDDSGSTDDPNHSCVTVAGYVSTEKGWDWFEYQWSRLMEFYKVPYLHMKEFGKPEGVYKEIKAIPDGITNLLDDCIRIIHTATEYHVSSTIRLLDIKEFNKETGMNLEPLPLALYGCLIELRDKYPDSEMEIFIDRVTKPHLVINKAIEYARSDTYVDLKVGSMRIVSLSESESFRNVLPIQAADFTAYEIRKHCEEHKTFNPPEEMKVLGEPLDTAYLEWEIDFTQRNNRPPRNRMSARMLSAWPPANGYIWDTALIMGAHLNRHKNGWG